MPKRYFFKIQLNGDVGVAGGKISVNSSFLNELGNPVTAPSSFEGIFNLRVTAQEDFQGNGIAIQNTVGDVRSGDPSISFNFNTKIRLEPPSAPAGYRFLRYQVTGAGSNSGLVSSNQVNVFDEDFVRVVAIYQKVAVEQEEDSGVEIVTEERDKINRNGGSLRLVFKYFVAGQPAAPLQGPQTIRVRRTDNGDSFDLNPSIPLEFNANSPFSFRAEDIPTTFQEGTLGTYRLRSGQNFTVNFTDQDLNLRNQKTLEVVYDLQRLASVGPGADYRLRFTFLDTNGTPIANLQGSPNSANIAIDYDDGDSENQVLLEGVIKKIRKEAIVVATGMPVNFNVGSRLFTLRDGVPRYSTDVTDSNISEGNNLITDIIYEEQEQVPLPEDTSQLRVRITYINSNGSSVTPFINNVKTIGVNTTNQGSFEIKDDTRTPIGQFEIVDTTGTFGNITLSGYPNSIEFEGETLILQTPRIENINANSPGVYRVDIKYRAEQPTIEDEPEELNIRVRFNPSKPNELSHAQVRVNGKQNFKRIQKNSDGSQDIVLDAKQGENYVITFSNVGGGYITPNRISNAKAGRTYTGLYRKPPEPPKPVLTVSTDYLPNIPQDASRGDIYVNGDLVGNGSVRLEVNPGDYNISFGDISVLGYVYTTPASQRVVLNMGDTRNISGTYNGRILPSAYWLKPIDDIDSKFIAQEKIEGLFSSNIRNLTTFFTSSLTASLEDYYVHVYQDEPTIVTSSIQFSLAYGNFDGYGADDGDVNAPNITETKAIYSQYRNKLLENAAGKFNLTGAETDNIYVINYQHERLKESLDYGAFEINLAHLSGSEYIASNEKSTHTGSNVILSGTDEVLRLINNGTSTNADVGVYGLSYDIVSGSIEDGIYNSTTPHVYGKLYVNHGVILLDGDKLDLSASFGTVDVREVDGDNAVKLYTAISGAAQYTDASGDALGMKARRKVVEHNEYYFIRILNDEFNKSNNSSYYSGSEGFIDQETLRVNGITYITSIGLYNDQRELLAIGKLSQPVKKDFVSEHLFKVRLKH